MIIVLVDISHNWQMSILSRRIILLPGREMSILSLSIILHQEVFTTGRCLSSQIMRDDIIGGVSQDRNHNGMRMVYFRLAC